MGGFNFIEGDELDISPTLEINELMQEDNSITRIEQERDAGGGWRVAGIRRKDDENGFTIIQYIFSNNKRTLFATFRADIHNNPLIVQHGKRALDSIRFTEPRILVAAGGRQGANERQLMTQKIDADRKEQEQRELLTELATPTRQAEDDKAKSKTNETDRVKIFLNTIGFDKLTELYVQKLNDPNVQLQEVENKRYYEKGIADAFGAARAQRRNSGNKPQPKPRSGGSNQQKKSVQVELGSGDPVWDTRVRITDFGANKNYPEIYFSYTHKPQHSGEWNFTEKEYGEKSATIKGYVEYVDGLGRTLREKFTLYIETKNKGAGEYIMVWALKG